MRTIKVWDLPTRLFHGLLLAAVLGLLITANLGGNWMVWHLRLGHGVLALLVFRLAWGFMGGHWSRFASFLYGPASIRAYLYGQGEPRHRLGHNPLGALSVWAMLAVLALQVGTGLMSDDDIAFFGPLTAYVSADAVKLATAYHTQVGKWLLLALVALHLAAVLYHQWVRREPLVGAMVHGRKPVDDGTPPLPESADGARQRAAALVLALAAGLFAAWVASLGTVG